LETGRGTTPRSHIGISALSLLTAIFRVRVLAALSCVSSVAESTSTDPLGYLETDKPENVTFYKRFGFEVVDEHPVLGIKNWFMLRDARG
jgi:hypothetical protein